MSENNKEIIKKLFESEQLYCIFSAVTRHPFAVCDPATYEDQFFFFEKKEDADIMGKSLALKKYASICVQIPKTDLARRKIFVDAYAMGCTQIVYTDEAGKHVFALDEIVSVSKDFENLPPEKRPLINQTLALTALYFAQELNRPVPLAEKPDLEDLTEEFAHDLAKAVFLAAGRKSPDTETDPNKQLQIMQIQDKNGKKYLPVFSDAMEYGEFKPAKDFRGFPATLKTLRAALNGSADAIMLNPGSVRLQLTAELIDSILAVHAEESEAEGEAEASEN